eukprot:CAMPEP_0185569272 /NCGR_PEP_ID=MMETSP0434-20130131/1947_1 /TAXON_ID=626734 ORGANISM="Favella taraikaensis, Strain Fe Narragansett Bay" /NCGR_SAMPLE_ID=MMETSP0434 /ASSEMBLY_ACC=CAM_ASM_000379 /LENGTH=100 /DNA_ID=CAMNT_0028184009 /DNA_START=828 /DNA_END=1130 /DNA_ORIENTATION=-
MSEEVEKCMRMLQVHNAKVNRIRQGYTDYCSLRQKAAAEGIPFEQYKELHDLEEENSLKKVVKSAKTKKAVSGIAAAKKKFAAKAKNDVGVTIKVKDEDG